MCKLFLDWEQEIRSYCRHNGLDFSKVEKSGKCWSGNLLMLQHVDPQKGRMGLRDETPAPITLLVRKEANKLIFEQTEFTKKYLAW